MMGDIEREAERIARQGLGAGADDPVGILHRTVLEFPHMESMVVVVKLPNGDVVTRAGGGNMIEMLGMLQFAGLMAIHSKFTPAEPS